MKKILLLVMLVVMIDISCYTCSSNSSHIQYIDSPIEYADTIKINTYDKYIS